MRRFEVSFLKKEPTQTLAKNYTASLLLFTVLCLTASEDRSVFLFCRNGIHILGIDLQLFLYKSDVINARLLKNQHALKKISKDIYREGESIK